MPLEKPREIWIEKNKMLQTRIKNSIVKFNSKNVGNTNKAIRKYTFCNVTLETKDQINNFVAAYPACTIINGSLLIKNEEVTDLSFLNNIISINGDFRIGNSPYAKI